MYVNINPDRLLTKTQLQALTSLAAQNQGFNNQISIVETNMGPAVVKRALTGSIHTRLHDSCGEWDILCALENKVSQTPLPLAVSHDKQTALYSLVGGKETKTLRRGAPSSKGIELSLAKLFNQLAVLEDKDLVGLPRASEPGLETFLSLQKFYNTYLSHQNITINFDALYELIFKLKTQPARLCHLDLHNNNILADNNNNAYIIDWEMAQVTDPTREIAILLSKFSANRKWTANVYRAWENTMIGNRKNIEQNVAIWRQIDYMHSLFLHLVRLQNPNTDENSYAASAFMASLRLRTLNKNLVHTTVNVAHEPTKWNEIIAV